jgi:rod shape-determining protein MreC
MSHYQKKLPRSLFLILLVLFVSFLSIFGLFRTLGFSPFLKVENFAIRSFQPVILFLEKTGSSIQKRWTMISNLSSIQKRMEELEYQIRLDDVQDAINDNLITENQQLRSWLGLIKESDYTIELADVVYRDQQSNFVISKGLSSKIKNGFPVILPLSLKERDTLKLCLIGRIDQTNVSNAHVLSILDKTSKISAKNMRTQVNGLVEYDTKQKKLFFSTYRYDNDLKKGDLIVTNELSQFPKGLIIGYIESEEEVSFNNKVVLKLPFDIFYPSQVGVILQ